MRRGSPAWLDVVVFATARSLRRRRSPLKVVARNLGVTVTTLRDWVHAGRPEPAAPLIEDERSELQRLRRENQQLRMERDILKKATAFFARETP
jgi:transposase-like protein